MIPIQTADAATMLDTSGENNRCSASSSNKNAGRTSDVHRASSMPNAPPVMEMTMLSERSPRASWPRPAPSATRSEVSCDRAKARPMRNEATLAQAMKNTRPAVRPSSVPTRELLFAASGVIQIGSLMRPGEGTSDEERGDVGASDEKYQTCREAQQRAYPRAALRRFGCHSRIGKHAYIG